MYTQMCLLNMMDAVACSDKHAGSELARQKQTKSFFAKILRKTPNDFPQTYAKVIKIVVHNLVAGFEPKSPLSHVAS